MNIAWPLTNDLSFTHGYESYKAELFPLFYLILSVILILTISYKFPVPRFDSMKESGYCDTIIAAILLRAYYVRANTVLLSLTQLVPTTAHWDEMCYYPHFTDKGNEAQED